MDRVALSRALFRRGEKETAKPAGTTRIYQGTATSDSDGGLLTIAIDGPAFTADGTQSIDAVCTPAVKAGQTVQVAVIDGSPVVLGATGWGDEVDGTVQHFWHDSEGAHVSTEDGNAEGARNSLWTSVGMFFRKGAARLLALVADGTFTGLKVYDGEFDPTDPDDDEEDHVTSSFGPDAVDLGKNNASAVVRMCGGKGYVMYDTSTDTVQVSGPKGVTLYNRQDDYSTLGIGWDALNLLSVIRMRAGKYFLGWGSNSTWSQSQFDAAVGRMVRETGSYGDWTWQVYKDGTFDAWCNPSGARSYNFDREYHGWYYIEPTDDDHDGPWVISGLTYSSLTYVDVTPEFPSATIASLISKNVGTNGRGFKFFLMSLEIGNKSGRVLVHARGVI